MWLYKLDNWLTSLHGELLWRRFARGSKWCAILALLVSVPHKLVRGVVSRWNQKTTMNLNRHITFVLIAIGVVLYVWFGGIGNMNN